MDFVRSKFQHSRIGEFLFFAFFFFLVLVVYFGGLLNSTYFFWNFERNSILLFIPKVLWMLLVTYQLTFPQFGRNLVTLLYEKSFVDWFYLKLENFRVFLNSNPFLFFVFFHLLVCFTCLHLFMLYFTGLDLTVEFFYHFFNIIKLFFLVPLAIYGFFFINARLYVSGVPLPEWSPEGYLKAKKTFVKIAEDVNTLGKKYPKTSKGLTFGLVFTGWASLIGTKEKDRLISAETRFSSSDLNPQALAQSLPLQQKQREMFELENKGDESIISLGIQAIKALFKGVNSHSQDYFGVQKQALDLQNQTLSEIEKKKAEMDQERTQILRELKESGQTNFGKKTEEVIDYALSAPSPKVSSCLETTWDFFHF